MYARHLYSEFGILASGDDRGCIFKFAFLPIPKHGQNNNQAGLNVYVYSQQSSIRNTPD